MMGTVDKVSYFFAAHPKHQRALQQAISDIQPESNTTKIKDPCHTRWVQHIDVIHSFCNLHPSTVHCVEVISSEGCRL